MFKVELSENVSAKLRTPCFAQSVQLYKLPPAQPHWSRVERGQWLSGQVSIICINITL